MWITSGLVSTITTQLRRIHLELIMIAAIVLSTCLETINDIPSYKNEK